MRFDYQPALVDIKFLKTYKQKKLFFSFLFIITVCLFVLFNIISFAINYNNNSSKIIGLNKKLFLASNIFKHHKLINNYKLYTQNNNNINKEIFNNNKEYAKSYTTNEHVVNLLEKSNLQANLIHPSNNSIGVNIKNYRDLSTNDELSLKYKDNLASSGGVHLHYRDNLDINRNLSKYIAEHSYNNDTINYSSLGLGIYNNPNNLQLTNSITIKSNQNKQRENLHIVDNWLTVKIKPGNNLISMLQNLSIPKTYLKDFINFITVNQNCKSIHNLKSGYSIKVLLNEEKDLQNFILPLAPYKILHIEKVGPRNYRSYFEEKPIIKQLTFAKSKILGSFYASAQSAGLNDSLIMEMADIFGWDIDFSMDIRSNDKFKIIYEEKFVEQEKISTGHIVVAEFINQGQKYQAIRFVDNQGKVGYYTPEGYSMNKTFLRNPVKFTRIGSKFSNSRHHPILHKLRAHKGVDYVAPSGTPVKAAGDGRVILIGYKGGYGNVIELLHGNKYTTLYAHLSYFAQGIKKGQVVKQGQIIGYVGKTGLATGDHLHYEFRVDGVHRDPLTVQLPRAMPLPSRYKPKFLSHAKQMINLLNEKDITSINKT